MRLSSMMPALVSVILLSGCHRPEVVIANPLSAGAVEPNHIVHQARWAEGQSGLPPGTLADEARLVSADARQVCFDVTTRVPSDALLDLSRVSAVMRTPGGVGTPSSLKAEPPTTRSFEGQIPQRTQVGTVHTCLISDPNTGACRTWDDRPKMGTVYVPGTVRVRQQSAEICFDNTHLLTAASDELVLEISQDGHRVGKYRWGLGATAQR